MVLRVWVFPGGSSKSANTSLRERVLVRYLRRIVVLKCVEN